MFTNCQLLFEHGALHRFTFVTSPRNISNFTATKLIKELYRSSDNPKSPNVHHQDGTTTNVLETALEIFHQVKEPKNHFLINTMLKMCIHHHSTPHVHSVWTYIESADKAVQRGIAYGLLVKYHVSCGHIGAGLNVLKWMERQKGLRLKIDGAVITKLIAGCDSVSDLDAIHRLIQHNVVRVESVRNGTDSVKAALIRRNGAFRNIDGAVHVFESMADSEKDAVSMRTMMWVLIDNGHPQRALDLYDRIGVGPFSAIPKEAASHCLALRACRSLKAVDRGLEIVRKERLRFAADLKLQTLFIEFCGEFGRSDEAMSIFEDIADRDIIAVGAIMKALLVAERHDDALSVYNAVGSGSGSVDHDAITHSLALKSCGALKRRDGAQRIHAVLRENGFDRDLRVSTALIDCYGHCGDAQSARTVFESVPSSKMDTVAIGAMMSALIAADDFVAALALFDGAAENGNICKMDIVHLAIKCCAGCNDFERGQQIAADFAVEDSVNGDALNTMIAFYGHFGEIDAAQSVFNAMGPGTRGIVTFNAMMTAFIQNECHREALALYDRIDGGLERDDTTHSLAIKACGCSNELDKGRRIIAGLRLGDGEGIALQIANTLIDFHGLCGDLAASLSIFDSIDDDKKDIVTINAMMASYIGNGRECAAEQLLHSALTDLGLKADSKTFCIRLNARSHSGDVGKALQIWNHEMADDKMKNDRYIVTCLVDCHSRKGLLQRARSIIARYENAAKRPYEAMWIALLSGSRNHGDRQMAEKVFAEIEERFGSKETVMNRAKVLLSNTMNATKWQST